MNSTSALIRIAVLVVMTTALTYPVLALAAHGLDPAFWPTDVVEPNDWFGRLRSLSLGGVFGPYWAMAIGRSPAFSHGGLTWFWGAMTPLSFSVVLLFFNRPREPLRDTSGVFGNARFATSAELDATREGLELGINPETGRAVRVKVEGTLVTIAPPRKGKTWGLLIPNLAFAEETSWDGPAVVLDTKGEVYRAVAARRQKLGSRVVCLDPVGLVGGRDTWNPLASIDAEDILHIQRTALALLPEATGDSEASAYFRNRAVDLLVGAMVVSLRLNKGRPAWVRNLLDDSQTFINHLQAQGPVAAARTALAIMEADPKTRDPILSTATQAFQWLTDDRMGVLTRRSSFDLTDLSTNALDLFIAVPPDYRGLLAPFLRWFLSDLFAAIRQRRPDKRVLIMVDESAAIGRFSEILTAANELPGYGGSLWTFWQSRSQILDLYGEAGASTLVNTAEVVTTFNTSAVDPDETERWSRSLGEYTALLPAQSRSAGEKSTTTSHTPQPARLMTPSALVTMPADEMLAFVSQPGHAGHPMKLKKTTAFSDSRFKRFVITTPPVGVAED